MRFLHRRCVSKQALRDALDENETLRASANAWERECHRIQADCAEANKRYRVSRDQLVSERNAAREDLYEWRTKALDLEASSARLAEERDEAQAELATCQSDLRTARPLTRSEVERVVRENPTDDGELVEAILAAQRKAVAAPIEALQSAVETATDATTQEVGE